jgi:hypothetical protein
VGQVEEQGAEEGLHQIPPDHYAQCLADALVHESRLGCQGWERTKVLQQIAVGLRSGTVARETEGRKDRMEEGEGRRERGGGGGVEGGGWGDERTIPVSVARCRLAHAGACVNVQRVVT